MAAEKIYILKKPVTVASQTITELTFREPVAKDIKGLDLESSTADGKLTLLGRLSGQSDFVIDSLSLVDVGGAWATVESFLSGGDEGGNEP